VHCVSTGATSSSAPPTLKTILNLQIRTNAATTRQTARPTCAPVVFTLNIYLYIGADQFCDPLDLMCKTRIDPWNDKLLTTSRLLAASDKTKFPGDPCLQSSECIRGQCETFGTGPKKCVGAQIKEECQSHADCDAKLFCLGREVGTGGTCQKQIMIG
jgi:hypothetical protein